MPDPRKCTCCNATIYIKVKVYSKPILAPATHAQELMNEYTEVTGESFMPLLNNYCPMCGERVHTQTTEE